MVRRRRKSSSSRIARSKKAKTSRRSAGRAPSKSLKERLLTTAIWGLSLINVALIFSLVSNFFSSPNETAVSAGLQQVVRNETEPEQQRITVEVLNACGEQGLASQVTDYLRDKNFDVVTVGNYSGGYNLDHTLIFDRVSLDKKYAKQVAAALDVSPSQVVPELENSMQLMVTVLIGKDYKKLKLFAEQH